MSSKAKMCVSLVSGIRHVMDHLVLTLVTPRRLKITQQSLSAHRVEVLITDSFCQRGL